MNEVGYKTVDTVNREIIFQDNKSYGYHIVKRLTDIIGSMAALMILSPIFLFVSILIKLESKGPSIFSQIRVGKHGELFKMYKFRSMIMDAEEKLNELKEKNEMSGPMFKMKDDPRVTKIGRFIRRTSIDELPQFWNVLKGEMSLVGPRPNLPKEVQEFEPWMLNKLTAKPGLTCYWQVSGRNDIDFEDWMKLDMKYVEERNVILDIKLIFKTALLLLGDKHAR